MPLDSNAGKTFFFIPSCALLIHTFIILQHVSRPATRKIMLGILLYLREFLRKIQSDVVLGHIIIHFMQESMWIVPLSNLFKTDANRLLWPAC
jgi:hypothetical protein